jgi:hypothetical protein
MKKVLVLSVLMVVVSTLFVGCDTETPEPTYKVWTDSISYSDYFTLFGFELNDGYWASSEFTNEEFSSYLQSVPNAESNNWTENQIYNWFIGRGFDNTEANQAKAWLMTVNHGGIAYRRGSIVYGITK